MPAAGPGSPIGAETARVAVSTICTAAPAPSATHSFVPAGSSVTATGWAWTALVAVTASAEPSTTAIWLLSCSATYTAVVLGWQASATGVPFSPAAALTCALATSTAVSVPPVSAV